MKHRYLVKEHSVYEIKPHLIGFHHRPKMLDDERGVWYDGKTIGSYIPKDQHPFDIDLVPCDVCFDTHDEDDMKLLRAFLEL